MPNIISLKGDDEGVNYVGLTLWSLLGVLLVTACWHYFTQFAFWLADNNYDKASKWGDSYGIVNSWFSALAFLGIIITILLQTRELELQRRELEDTRAELAKTADSQERSAEALKQQAEASLHAAYLNAITSLQASYHLERAPAVEHFVTPNAAITAILEGMVAKLSGTVTAAADDSIAWRAEQLSMIEEIARHRDTLKDYAFRLSDGKQAGVYFDAKALQEYLVSVMHALKSPEQQADMDIGKLISLLHTLTSRLPPQLDPSVHSGAFHNLIGETIEALDDWTRGRMRAKPASFASLGKNL